MRGRRADLVLGCHKTLRLSWIALKIIIEGCRLRNHGVAIQVEMTSRPEKWLMRSDKPYQQAEGFIAAVFLQPRKRTINGQVVGIDVVILLLGSDLALAPLFEERIRIVIAWVVVAEVIVPI